MNILEISRLTKLYGEHKALQDISFNVKRNTIFGLIGPNGAGKTTLLRIINSILVSDSGEVKINGMKAGLDTTSKIIGYMPEERGLYPKMKVEDQIMYFGLLKGFDKRTLYQNMIEYTELFNIADDRKRKVEELSKGNQQKVQIISTIVYNPELIILDEPFSGFDPINGALLTNVIERLSQNNSTVILSSHNMPAIENMCSDIALLNKGQLLLNGNLNDIKETHKSGILEISTRNRISTAIALDSKSIADISETTLKKGQKGFRYLITPTPHTDNNAIIHEISMQGEIIHFEEVSPTLSDLFMQYTSSTSHSQA